MKPLHNILFHVAYFRVCIARDSARNTDGHKADDFDRRFLPDFDQIKRQFYFTVNAVPDFVVVCTNAAYVLPMWSIVVTKVSNESFHRRQT